MDQWDVPYYWTFPAPGVVCFVVGFLFGLPALRLQGLYLALATFALATAMPQILKFHPLEALTGGVQGIVILKPDPPPGLPLNADQWLYYFTLAVLLVMFAAAANLVNSRTGRAIMAIRDNPIAAAAMGINTSLYKTLTFGVSALYTGVAGALGAIAVQFVAPDSFTFLLSVSLLVGLVIGGVGSIPGCLFGGLFVLFVPEHRRERIDRARRRDLWHHPATGDLCHAVGRRRFCAASRLAARYKSNGEAQMKKISRRSILAAAPSALALAALPARAEKQYGPGVTDTEIKIGNTVPYSGPASSYGTIGKAEAAYFRMLNDQGRRQWAQDQLHLVRRRLHAAEDRRAGAQTGRGRRRFADAGTARHADQLGDPAISEPEKSAPAVRRHRRDQMERPYHFPWTMGWQPNYQSEGHVYAAYILEHKPNGKIGDPLSKRRFRQRLSEGPEGRARRQGQVDDHRRGPL